MYSIQLDKRVLKQLGDKKRYIAKIHRQITMKIFWLQRDPFPQDCRQIGIGYRVSSGEYRIFYRVDEGERVVENLLVGQRNDDRIYKEARELGLL